MVTGPINFGSLPADLQNKLSWFFTTELGGDALDGISYSIAFKETAFSKKTPKVIQEGEKCRAFIDILKAVKECHGVPDDIFRVFETSNGYIADMDPSIVKIMSVKVAEGWQDENLTKNKILAMLETSFNTMRVKNMTMLGKQVVSAYKSGKDNLDVALFNRNKVPYISVTGNGLKGESLLLTYKSYALRPWDLEEVNRNILMPRGLKISHLIANEILPSKHGVRFTLAIEGGQKVI